MLRIAFLTFIALAIAFGGGGASVSTMLQHSDTIASLRIGSWTASPTYGTAGADPYSRARIARQPEFPLGSAEGLTFMAKKDGAGAMLRLDCSYRLEGSLPAARFWTLYATGEGVGGGKSGLHSQSLLRQDEGRIGLTISRHPHSGNWLSIAGKGSMALVLTLYDTPVANSATRADITLPQITRIGCDG